MHYIILKEKREKRNKILFKVIMVKIISQCHKKYINLRSSVKLKHNKHDENCLQVHYNQIAQNSDKEKNFKSTHKKKKKTIYRGTKINMLQIFFFMETV